MTPLCVLGCVTGYILVALFTLALCRAAAMGDEQLGLR